MKEKIIEIMYMVEKMPPSKLETDIIVKLMELKDMFNIDSTNIIAHNGKEVGEELKTILKLSTDVMFLKDENETLNKGIDELIKQCENEILEYEEFFKPNSKIHQLIFSEDEYYATINFRNKLKKLKGE